MSTKCGYENKISPEEIYASEDEYQSDLRNPYKGIPDEDVVRLLGYEEIENIGGKDNIFLVRDPESGELFVKKILSTYDAVNDLAAKFEAADGLVVASPVYYASANAMLIACLDRLFYSTSFDKTMKVPVPGTMNSMRGNGWGTDEVMI